MIQHLNPIGISSFALFFLPLPIQRASSSPRLLPLHQRRRPYVSMAASLANTKESERNLSKACAKLVSALLRFFLLMFITLRLFFLLPPPTQRNAHRKCCRCQEKIFRAALRCPCISCSNTRFELWGYRSETHLLHSHHEDAARMFSCTLSPPPLPPASRDPHSHW